MTLLSI